MDYLIDFSKQFADGANAAGDIKVSGQFDRVVFCGMGGSAIPGEVITMLWLDGLNCYVNREYGLPYWVDKKCLVICTSWSGNTEETLSSFREAVGRGVPVAAVAGKGRLLEEAKQYGIPSVKLPESDKPARFVVGAMLSAILTLLRNSDIIGYIVADGADFKPVGKEFYSRIGDKIPLIYSSYQWRYLARFWKIHFNENCKVHAFSNFFPEAAHNEIAGYGYGALSGYFPIILTDASDREDELKKIQKFSAFLKNRNIEHEIAEIAGRSRLEKILKSYNAAVSASVGLANFKNIEPFDTSVIEEFKKS